MEVVFYSGSVFSSGDGAPWSSSTATSPARSAQGKGSWWLAEVKERVAGVKGGRGERGEGGHLLSASLRVSALSLPRPLQREGEDGQRSHACERGVEERSGVRGRVARGGGFYSARGRR
jgi:hypothetical protein